MKNICECCNYKTESKYNYKRHLLTKKHKRNIRLNTKKYFTDTKKYSLDTKKYLTDTHRYSNDEKSNNIDNKQNICKFCTRYCSTKSNLCKHSKICKTKKQYEHIILQSKLQKCNLEFNKYKNDVKSELQQKQKRLQHQTMLIKKQTMLIKQYKQENDYYKSKIQLLIEIKDMCQKKAATPKKSVMNIIINNFTSAPNLSAQPIKDLTHQQFKRYMDMGIPDGVVKMIEDYYITDVPNEQRSLWCLDPARVKYLIRQDDNWHVDMNGVKVKRTIMPSVHYKLMTMLNDKEMEESLGGKRGLMHYLDKACTLNKKGGETQILKRMSTQFMLKNN